MEQTVVGNRARTTRSTRPPRPWARALRPFGYLSIGLVWLAIWAFVATMAWGILVFGVVDGGLTVDEFTEPATSSVGALLAAVLLGVPLLAVIAGPVVLWWLPNCTWPLAVLSFVYVVRSLRPSYAAERLSFTAYGAAGSTLGPPTATNVALSLQPVRSTALTRFLMRFYAAGWQPDGRGFLVMLPAGLGWLLLFPAIAVDVAPTTNVVCGVLAVLLIGGSYAAALRTLWRGGRTKGRSARGTRGPAADGDLSPSTGARGAQ